LFRGHSLPTGFTRVYGGQVLAQSVVAAQRTVSEPRGMHSMHAYFLLAGDPKAPIIYEVERVRDGGSFTTRRVKAVQHGQAIFVMSASFHKLEASYDHQIEMPKVPGPDELPSERELRKAMVEKLPENLKSYLMRDQPMELRLVEAERYRDRKPAPPVQHVWLRANGRLPDDSQIHHCVLTYASDFTLLDTALVAHGKLMFDTDVQLASLDHAIWIHRPFRADEWLLYAQDSPSATGARGFCRGNIFKQDGTLVASTVQEGLMRQRQTAFVVK
ncbi:MAG: acyl-CoA thioesterase II, partial [Hyphomicrobiaceae bacterium]